MVIKSSNKTIGPYEFNDDNLNVFAVFIENNPSLGVVSSKDEVCLVRHNEVEDVKHEYTVLEEDDGEILFLENLLEKSESNCEWKPQVNKLCFNSFDEEMKHLEGCIGKDESVKNLVSLYG